MGKARDSVAIRLLLIGLLIVVLLIPTFMISGLVSERQHRKEEAIKEVAGKWAGVQTVGGPMLTVPYTERDALGKPEAQEGYLHFLPDLLDVEVKLNPEARSRGIYRVIVYSSRALFRGRFSFDTLNPLGVPAGDIHWQEATITVGITDMRGIKEYIVLQWQGLERTFAPGVDQANGLFYSGVSARTPIAAGEIVGRPLEFAFALNLRGSEDFSLLPLGRTTSVKMESSWDSPSFNGAFLPEKRTLDGRGFTASWKILDMNRNYPQEWVGDIDRGDVTSSAFGLSLISPVDDYTNTSRAVKYAIMFLALTFLVFFMIEIFNKKRIHPVQYLLVGLALCLFYVLLLSLSEHLGFAAAFLVAGLGVVGLITFYTGSSLGWRTTAPLCGALLLALYGYLYILLRNQDYALLLGSLGLFAILAAVMFISRKVDWYAIEGRRRGAASQDPDGDKERGEALPPLSD